jgi:hypothetical protein
MRAHVSVMYSYKCLCSSAKLMASRIDRGRRSAVSSINEIVIHARRGEASRMQSRMTRRKMPKSCELATKRPLICVPVLRISCIVRRR